MLRRHGVPAVRTAAFSSLCEAVASQRGWMTAERGEGLVLSVARPGKASLYKWKISREPQPAAKVELADLLTELRAGAGGRAALLDPAIVAMVDGLHAVAMHVDSAGDAHGAAAVKAPKAGKAAVVDATAVDVAIASAKTKFDTLEATFEASGKGALNHLTERLSAEVLADADLALPTGGEREAAVREVTTRVKRHVGQAYGAWLKSSRLPVVIQGQG